MRRVLIAGCGYVGARTADVFHDAGWAVEGWTRSAESASALSDKPFPIHCVDISDAGEVAAKSLADFDVVVHCASTRGGNADAYRRVYWNGMRNLLSRFSGARFQDAVVVLVRKIEREAALAEGEIQSHIGNVTQEESQTRSGR